MKSLLFFALILLCSNLESLNAQCTYKWLLSENNNIDTLIKLHNCLGVDVKCEADIDYDKIVNSFTIMKDRPEHIIFYKGLIDSLNKLPKDSIICKAIEDYEELLESRWSVLETDTVGYAQYGFDTLFIDGQSIIVYRIVSNFKMEWNIDFNNWFFYYTTEFGVIHAKFVCIWDAESPCFAEMTLVDNCHINPQNRLLFEKVRNYAVKENFGYK